MPCFHPMTGYRSRRVNESGKRSIVFNGSEGYVDLPVSIPCGQCLGCRLEKSRQWAIRCLHEAKLYEKNCFITLTYNDENLPKDNSLVVADLQKFLKRLRKKYGAKIRFFACGEYGDKLKRPHYHVCLFNFDFPQYDEKGKKDKYYWKNSNGYKLYRAESLEKLWDKGNSLIGDLTFESAAYTARYVTKKITGKAADEHYNVIDYETGEVLIERKPEFITMSRRPGVGREFLEKWGKDIYAGDFVVIRGKKMRPPKYYDKRFEIENGGKLEIIKSKRKKLIRERSDDNNYVRLRVREEIQELKFKQLKRGFEYDEDLFSS